jgi:hopanoid biosynthesis associated RND transporter like protein HpnN
MKATCEDIALERRWLAGWVDLVRRSALWVLLISVLSGAGALVYAAGHLGINTSTKEMLSEELPFRRNDRAMDAAFPQLEHQILVVVEAASAERAEAAATHFAAGLAKQPERYSSVFYPEGDAFFRRNGLLYLGLDELQSLADRLAAAQPMLATLKADMTLRGLAEVLDLAAEEVRGESAAVLAPALDAMAGTVEDLAERRPAALSWQELLTGGEGGPAARRRLIVVSPVLDYGSLEPAAPAIAGIKALVDRQGLSDGGDVRVRITGESVMLQDELKSVRDGIGLVGLMSFVLVAILLTIGLRSLRMVGATLLTLVVGLSWTAGFAAMAVGELNLISVAFAVLFIGLSVDFGIHFALRVEEEVRRGAAPAESLRHAATGVGGALVLTAVAAAIGFFSFLPTTYRGLSELGLISGAGMFIALFANLTVLPAALALMRPAAGRSPPALGLGEWVQELIVRHAKAIAWTALALGLLALPALFAARFDDDPLNLRDLDSPSVAALLAVIDDARVEPYHASVLSEGPEAAAALAETLSALPEVARAVTLSDYVPSEQDDKLAIIEETAFFLTPLWARTPPSSPIGEEERRRAFAALKATAAKIGGGSGVDGAARLAAALARVDASPEGLLALERALLGHLPSRIDALAAALSAEPVSREDLPRDLVMRKLAADGQALVEVVPAQDLRDPTHRRLFVDAVQAVAPDATGPPIIITEAGRAVVDAFLQAAGTAVLLIALLLLAILRSVRDSLLVLAPLMLAALLTVAVTVVLGRPFNFANVIVLPLLFGLGVAGGIHMVMRHRGEVAAGIMHTSTSRAVVFSTLTTIGSFGTLATSGHPGTASMGALLTVAIGLSMLTSLIVLPALLTLVVRDHAAAAGVGKNGI